MNLLPYLLPLILIYPLIIDYLAGFNSRIRLMPVLFVIPAVLLALTLFTFISRQPLEIFLMQTTFMNFGLKLDVLSGLMASTVLTIGIIVIRFSVKYLEDDPKKERFLKNLSYTLSCVVAMLMASNLVLLFLSWMGTSCFLHRLLTHFSDRKGALKAAQQKFLVSRVGDFFIVCSAGLLFWVFKSLEFTTIFQMVKEPLFLEQNYFLINVASVLLVFGAMTKSAQFPFHFWLPNTMETPTPVSALMHAGIINAGGYLVVRMSPLLALTPLALSILAIVGGLTAFLAFVVMLTQTNVKRSLAYSTISQMGFMMLQCGLGAFSVAVIHIIGHAFYKAYAFLSSGTATDIGRLNRYFPKVQSTQSLWASSLIAIGLMTVIIGGSGYIGYDLLERPGYSVLLVILTLAISQILLSSKNKLKAVTAAVWIFIVYVCLSKIMKTLLVGIIPNSVSTEGPLSLLTLVVCATFFVALYFIQNSLEKISQTELGKKIYVKALNGAHS
jgi:NAD(P)H-quinone oxidoreductase subunit 5